MNALPAVDAHLTPTPPPVIGENMEDFLNEMDMHLRISGVIKKLKYSLYKVTNIT